MLKGEDIDREFEEMVKSQPRPVPGSDGSEFERYWQDIVGVDIMDLTHIAAHYYDTNRRRSPTRSMSEKGFALSMATRFFELGLRLGRKGLEVPVAD